MRNIKLTISYDGTDFHGWQRQNGLRTVQGVLEDAIHQLTGSRPAATASGRTDAGVHALGQVVHFLSVSQHSSGTFVKGLNAINLAETAITDVGLQKLGAVPVALRLDLKGTRVTKQGIAELKNATTILGVDGLK